MLYIGAKNGQAKSGKPTVTVYGSIVWAECAHIKFVGAPNAGLAGVACFADGRVVVI